VEENKLELDWTKKKMIFKQILTSEGTRIAPNTANMEKGLTHKYILPWTTPGRPKNHH